MNISMFGKTAELCRRIFDPYIGTIPMIPHKTLKPACTEAPVSDPLPRALPESEGVSSDDIAAYIQAMDDDPAVDIHGLLLLRHGKVIYEGAFGLDTLDIWKNQFSASKSVTSLAVGICVDRGLLSVKDKIIKLFDKKAIGLSKITVKDITVEDLLTMRSSVIFNEAVCMTEPDWQKGFINSMLIGEAGKTFYYNSLNTYMLAAAVTSVTGTSMSEFLKEALFSPLGITDFYWETCPQGIEKGGWGLYMRTEDMAKIGLLVQNGGLWKGKRLISENWLSFAAVTQAEAPKTAGSYNYGYQIWTSRRTDEYGDSFLFNGMFGQNVLSYRNNGILIAVTSSNEEIFQSSSFYSVTDSFFAKQFPDALPENPEGDKKLSELTAARKTAPKANTAEPLPTSPALPSPFKRLGGFLGKIVGRKSEPIKSSLQELPPECGALLGKRFLTSAPSFGMLPSLLQITQNNYTGGLTSISFEKNGSNEFCLVFSEKEQTFRLPLGFDEIKKKDLSFDREPFRVHNTAAFKTDEDGNSVLVINLSFTETPVTRKMKIRFFADGNARIEAIDRPGAEFIADMAIDIIKQVTDSKLLSPLFPKNSTEFIRYRMEKIFEPTGKLQKERDI